QDAEKCNAQYESTDDLFHNDSNGKNPPPKIARVAIILPSGDKIILAKSNNLRFELGQRTLQFGNVLMVRMIPPRPQNCMALFRKCFQCLYKPEVIF
ncbi:MAG: hypothetical protein AAB319_04295, partial [Pseudomonadota bacterium]